MPRTLSWKAASAVAVTCLMVALAGCSGGVDPDPLPTGTGAAPDNSGFLPVPDTDAWPFAVFERTQDVPASRTALVEGTLELRDGCLVVVSDSGTVSALMLDAAAYAWDGDALVMGDERWEIGDAVWFGGGAADRDGAATYGLPQGCPDEVFGTW